MMKNIKILAALLILVPFFVASNLAWAQSGGVLQGKAVDAIEKFALPTVQIAIMGTKIYGSTNVDGTSPAANVWPTVRTSAWRESAS